MRISLVRYALVVLATVVLVGCKSSESSLHAPSWSMSKLNPFSRDSDDATYPPKPSGLAAPSVSPPVGAGYADATSAAPGQSEYSNVAPGYNTSTNAYPNSPYAYSAAPTDSLASSAASANPATTPQRGYYDTGSGYGLAGQSGSTPSYQPPVGPGAATGRYGTAAGASRYGVVADRYGLNRGPTQASADLRGTQGSAATYPAIPNYDSQATSSLGGRPPYESVASPDYSPRPDSRYSGNSNASGLSVADSRYDSESAYGADARSLVGDRYAPEDTQAAGFNSDKGGRFADSPGDTSWNPGQTGYQPGQSGYEPGNTGYQPPDTSPYRSPVDSYSTSPFLPGSTKTYAPPTTTGSAIPQESFSDPQVQPQTDSQVIPAGGHTPPWPTRTL